MGENIVCSCGKTATLMTDPTGYHMVKCFECGKEGEWEQTPEEAVKSFENTQSC